METPITLWGISVLDVVRVVLQPEKNTRMTLRPSAEESNGNSTQCPGNPKNVHDITYKSCKVDRFIKQGPEQGTTQGSAN